MIKKAHLAIYSGIYAIVYTFCLYHNLTGITFPLFVMATLVFGHYCFREFEISVKKDSRFIALGALLIGISQMLTDNSFIHATNVIIVFGLLILYFMIQFIEDDNWSFSAYIFGILSTFVMSFVNMFAPFSDLSFYKESQGSEKKSLFPWKTILLSILCAFPVLAIVIALLSSADVFFSNIITSMVKIDKISIYLKISLLTVIVFLFSYGIFSFLIKRPFAGFNKEKNKWDTTIAITIGIMFDLVYVVFSFIQIFCLFMGNFSLPSGSTYAEYAREGFFQLLVVCMFNLVFVIVGAVRFNENLAVKILLTVTSICTFIMIASSAFRMILYIRYYYFTFYRILVLWTLLVIAFLMVEVTISIWKPSFNLFKASLITAMIFYLALAFSHTDYFVAKMNISERNGHSEFFLAENDYDDYNMLMNLSLDAAPVVLNPQNSIGASETEYLWKLENKSKDFRCFNLSVYIAKQYSKK